MATPSFAGRLQIAHVLFVDVVSYSVMPMDKQEQTLRALQEAVRNTDEFVRAHDSDQLISLPPGMAWPWCSSTTPKPQRTAPCS